MRTGGVFLDLWNNEHLWGKDFIDEDTRNLVGIVLLSVTGAGILLMLLLRPTPWADATTNRNPLTALKDSFNLFLTKAGALRQCINHHILGIR